MGENLREIVSRQFDVCPDAINRYSPLTLAYIGDDVYDMIVRTYVVEKGQKSANLLHKEASSLVNAGSQAKVADAIAELLTPEEADIYRRGRNSNNKSTAKNASIADYRCATGIEALMGYLYLMDRMDRAVELVYTGLSRAELI